MLKLQATLPAHPEAEITIAAAAKENQRLREALESARTHVADVAVEQAVRKLRRDVHEAQVGPNIIVYRNQGQTFEGKKKENQHTYPWRTLCAASFLSQKAKYYTSTHEW